MGGVGVSLSDNAFGTYFNPAGLAFSKGLQLGSSIVKPVPFFGNVVQNYNSLSVNLDEIGAFGLSGNFYWRGEQARLHDDGTRTASIEENYFNYDAKLSYAYPVAENIAIGGSIGLLRQNLSERGVGMQLNSGGVTSVLFDVGFFMKGIAEDATYADDDEAEAVGVPSYAGGRAERGITAGIALLNAGPSIAFAQKSQADPAPALILAGVSYSPVRVREVGILVAIEAEKRFGDEPVLDRKITKGAIDYWHFGIEVSVFRMLALRGGKFEDASGPKNSYWTWGIGIETKYASFNVARYTYALFPTWHFDGQFHWEF